MPSTLASLARFCGANPPGITTIHYMPTAWIDRDTYEYLIDGPGQFIGVIDPLPDRAWLSVQALPEGRAWEESQVTTGQGPHYPQQLRAIAPALRPGVAYTLAQMAQYRYLLLWRDRQGQAWLTGTLDCPLDFSATAVSGEIGSGLASYALTWASEVTTRSVGAQGVILS